MALGRLPICSAAFSLFNRHRSVADLLLEKFAKYSFRPVKSNFAQSSIFQRFFATESPEKIKVKFLSGDGELQEVEGVAGQNLLSLAHENNVELEGACEGSLACSTCHVVLEQDVYKKLEMPSDEENDMLDLAFGLTETSRLGCQVALSSKLEGTTVRIPSVTRNMAVDGYKPPKH